MVRQIQLTLPASSTAALAEAREILALCGIPATELTGVRADRPIVLLLFTLPTLPSGRVLEHLAERGLGSSADPDRGRLEILTLTSSTPRPPARPFTPRLPDRTSLTRFRVSDRTSLDEIYQRVDGTYHLTFDWVLTTVIAGIVCATGLVTRNFFYVIASYLLSPLMGPMQASTLGAILGERQMVIKGLRNELVGFAISLVVGVAVAAAIVAFPQSEAAFPWLAVNYTETPGSPFETLHYEKSDLVVGSIIALVSGFALALGISTYLSETIVGVAISTAVLPPVVASGINLVLYFYWKGVPEKADHDYAQWRANRKLVDAGFGFAMFAINWSLIMLGCGLLLRLKQVGRRGPSEPLPRARGPSIDERPSIMGRLSGRPSQASLATTPSSLEQALLPAAGPEDGGERRSSIDATPSSTTSSERQSGEGRVV